MTKTLAAIAGALAMTVAFASQPVAAGDYPDMRGVWKATYLAVEPSRPDRKGPLFEKAEWQLEIKQQQENVFWGISKWRPVGGDKWNELEATGSLNVNDPNSVTMVEKPANKRTKSMIDGKLADGKIYVNYMGLAYGTSYSAVLEKASGN